ncbi:MAG: hypothetical protein ACFFCQ_08185 [Promethearchaeota archaeon]
MDSTKQIFGFIRLLRPQFLLAYLIVGIGGITIGLTQDQKLTTSSFGILGFLPVILAAIGVHLRDEASDWVNGYDTEFGGMGVIREDVYSVKTVQILGFLFTIIGIILGVLQALFLPSLWLIGLPMLVVIVFVNYLTEEISLGHEGVTASSYWGTFLWAYLAQDWPITLSIALFSIFVYLLVFALIPYQDVGDYDVDRKNGKKTLTARLGVDGIGQLSIFIALSSLLVLYSALLVA